MDKAKKNNEKKIPQPKDQNTKSHKTKILDEGNNRLDSRRCIQSALFSAVLVNLCIDFICTATVLLLLCIGKVVNFLRGKVFSY